jgi:hypothetical protein
VHMQLGQWSEALPVRANLEAALGFVLPSRTAAAPEDYSAGVIIRLTAWYLASAVPHTTYSMAPIHPAWPTSEGTVSRAARLAPRHAMVSLSGTQRSLLPHWSVGTAD